MCTAISFHTKAFYFGRTLDFDVSYSEEVIITPRCFPLYYRNMQTQDSHYAIIGIGCVSQDYPLYYDAVNEKGLAMAGLNFPGNACYHKRFSGADNIASFELIPWILSQCDSVDAAEVLLSRLNLTDDAFCVDLMPTDLHWLLADRNRAVTIEPMSKGLQIYENPVGVLTNNPVFPWHMQNLSLYGNLTSREPENCFAKELDLKPCSRGMGALGLPGDLSSPSRFVRASFTKWNSKTGSSESESVSQFFHILETVSQTNGCCRLDNGNCEKTLYTSCCNADRGIYYYTTYENRQITGICMQSENMEGTELIRFPLKRTAQFRMEN